jgi:hypothetical protein
MFLLFKGCQGCGVNSESFDFRFRAEKSWCLTPGSNPTIVIYNASVEKTFSTTSRVVRF